MPLNGMLKKAQQIIAFSITYNVFTSITFVSSMILSLHGVVTYGKNPNKVGQL